ncbi:MAG: hypothetical protein ACREDK_05410 [Thermoplasmata archaeon]
MRTFVKISGIDAPEPLALVPDGGAAGFLIDVDGAPGGISFETAAGFVEKVPTDAEAWATVLHPSAETIHRLFDEVGVDRVQVYGTIPPDLEFLEIHHLVPSLPVPPDGTEGPEPAVPPAEDYPRLHLDVAGTPWKDGSARRADWAMCARLVDQQPGRKLVLAGGITPASVTEALESVHPWGVDVTAGVRGEDGRIDLDRVRALLDAVAQHEKSHP